MSPTLDASQADLHRAELDHLLSAVVDPHTHLGRILRHLSEAHFAGKSDALKEYSIAVDALGRASSFDPKVDSIVRVEIHKLRKLLREYYEASGSSRPVTVAIAPGGYRLTFLTRDSNDPGVINNGIRNVEESGSTSPAIHDSDTEEVKDTTSEPEAIAASVAMPDRTANYSWRVAISLLGGLLLLALTFVWFAGPGGDQVDQSASANTAVPGGSGIAAVASHSTIPVPSTGPIRISAGATEDYTDRNGRHWGADQGFEGGRIARVAVPTVRFTRSPELFHTCREGDFRYHIPLQPGFYEVRLYFAETQYGESKQGGGGESSRMFRVSINGNAVMDPLDVVADAGGPDIALVRTFPGQRPDRDGMIHIRFESLVNEKAFVNAIEVVPGLADRTVPLRLAVGSRRIVDSRGNEWDPEDYYDGGRIRERSTVVAGGPSPGLFGAERFGNFHYRLPAALGHTYTVNVWMAEQFFTPEVQVPRARLRRFDILANGTTLANSIDIVYEAGGALKGYRKTFRSIGVAPQGYVDLHFTPISNYALVNALEFIDEGPKK